MFKIRTRKDWTLKEFHYDTGLQFGMKLKKPIRYVSDQPTQLPSVSDIEWIQTLHGRAPATATGVKRVRPELAVFCICRGMQILNVTLGGTPLTFGLDQRKLIVSRTYTSL